jgi:hypothetical protein
MMANVRERSAKTARAEARQNQFLKNAEANAASGDTRVV